jgi:hypothetical protein
MIDWKMDATAFSYTVRMTEPQAGLTRCYTDACTIEAVLEWTRRPACGVRAGPGSLT